MTVRESLGNLAADVEALRRRMLLLSRILPVPYLRFLDGNLEELEASVRKATLLRGLSNSLEFVQTHVEAALHEVWDGTAAE